ncbi:hypothetical protein DL546_003640 [Coniochaeta pulveracea]|uniref:Minor histocompatibility antigen H13 n=1 Tax=Coniochaeta pulveracea TaxID=177199 RepID=A0A420Y5V5_9PEZI|nr:hypothetical protein DL546_003640 [Coniochaeta pulveracea]
MMPVLASVVLVGLYYLIKWMDDPDLLNKIIRGYMSIMSVASMGKLASHGLQLITSLVFPDVWTDRAGRTYQIDGTRRQHVLMDSGPGSVPIVARVTPFPGYLSRVTLPSKVNNFLWTIRHLFMEEWTLKAALHGLGSANITLKLNDMLGFNIAIITIVTYYITQQPYLSNVLGTAFCYMTFGLMSPTSFAIGSAVLFGLFVYDIVMVFYTPYMITVATKLDVPIKLTFQNAKGHASILGLGDIVLPGIFIALALRFDLWRYYNSQIELVPTELTTELTEDVAGNGSTTRKNTKTQHRAVKKPYVSPKGQWGNRLWTQGVTKLFGKATATQALMVSSFPKTYFYAAMLGYLVGMLLTMLVLLIFRHGQPALLYLVPCVTGAVWLTGAIRGELGLMWKYTEDGSLDTQDIVVETDGNGNVIKEVTSKPLEESEKEKDKAVVGGKDGKTPKAKKDDNYPVFLLALIAPRQEDIKEE